MHRILIHIGLHKTATTYLQRSFFPELIDIEIYHAPRFFDQIGKIQLNEKDLLISNEGISGVAWNELWKNGIQNEYHWIDSFKNAIGNLKILFPDAIILVLYRKHGELLISMYKQYIQEGGVLQLNRFYN